MAKTIRSADQWIIFDYAPDDDLPISILQTGQITRPALSPRRLDAAGSQFLMPRIEAGLTGKTLSSSTVVDGIQVTTSVYCSPATGTPAAAAGLLSTFDSDVPRPLVGVLEWKIRVETSEVHVHWDEGMWELYESSPKDNQDMSMGTWMNKFLVDRDKIWFKRIIDQIICGQNKRRHLVPYEILTPSGTKRLTVSAWTCDEPFEKGYIWARGVVREEHNPSALVLPGQEPPSDRETLFETVVRLLPDSLIFALIDRASWEAIWFSKSWKSAGLLNPHRGRILDVVSSEDLPMFIKAVTDLHQGQSRLIRLVTHDGRLLPLAMKLKAAGPPDTPDREVMLLFSRPSHP